MDGSRTLLVVFLCFMYLVGRSAAKSVVVTGAAGRTGSLVFRKLLSNPNFSPLGVVKSPSSMKAILKRNDVANEKLFVADVADPAAVRRAFVGAEFVIMCTSAVPKIKILSLVKTFFFKIFRRSIPPEFYFPAGSEPYSVDWLGAKNQIDAAKEAGVQHFVLLSSMGGTNPDHPLNKLGRVTGDDKSGNILQWKRKAEEYLIQSGMKYTIVHAGGLLDQPGGQRELVLGVNDELLKGDVRTVPREDVASVCVAALEVGKVAEDRSIDLAARAPQAAQREVCTDFNAFFQQQGNCAY